MPVPIFRQFYWTSSDALTAASMQKRPKVHRMFLCLFESMFLIPDKDQRVVTSSYGEYSFQVLDLLSWSSKHAEARLQKNVIVWDANLKREKPRLALRDTAR